MSSTSSPALYDPMSPKIRYILMGFVLITLLIILILVAPRFLGFYYGTRGGLLFKGVFSSDSGRVANIACARSPLEEKNERAQVERAIDILQKSIRYNKNESQSYLLLGQAYCLLGQNEKAISAYQSYTKLRPQNPLGHLELGFAYEANCRASINTGQTAASSGNSCMEPNQRELITTEWRRAGLPAVDFLTAGEESRAAKQYEDAFLWYDRAELLAPENRDSIFYKGMIYAQQGRNKLALQYFQKALNIQYSLDNLGSGDIYYQIGLIYQLGFSPPDLDRAFESYNKAIVADDFKNDAWLDNAYYRRGEVTLWLGNSSEEAMRDFEKVVSLNPGHLFARILLAATYYEVYKDASRAETELMRVIAVDPNNKWAFRHLGMIYQAENRIADAKSAYQKVLDIDPSDDLAKSQLDILEKQPQ